MIIYFKNNLKKIIIKNKVKYINRNKNRNNKIQISNINHKFKIFLIIKYDQLKIIKRVIDYIFRQKIKIKCKKNHNK